MSSSAHVSRRGVLRWGGAGVIASLVGVPLGELRAVAAPPGREVEPVGGLVEVFLAEGGSVELPDALGFRLPLGRSVLAGADTVRVVFDPGVYSADGGIVRTGDDLRGMSFAVVRRADGRAHVDVAVADLPEGGTPVDVVVGRLAVPAFPDDLVGAADAVRLELLSAGEVLDSEEVGGALHDDVLPWGLRLSVGWRPHESGSGLRTWCPTLCTVTSEGPGASPAGAAIRVLLDPRSHPGATPRGGVSSADGAPRGEVAAVHRGLTCLTWTATESLTTGESVQFAIDCSGRGEDPGSSWSEPPLVEVCAGAASARGRRHAGAQSATRLDEVLTPAQAATALGV